MPPVHPTLLPGTKVSLSDSLASAGGVASVIVPDWSELTWQDAIAGAGGTRGYARLVLPFDSRSVQYASALSVLRIDDPRADGSLVTEEFRITELDDTAETGIVVATCAPILLDVGRRQMRRI